ncbi:MAG: hypothetical protein CVV25_01120 [Ignavibacteriae bacterium HGW-Ignavibacteriae-4]|jgi:hypothetical protein|nr:MAG: hypothetical protein CVV25_01120 [Ignavibacteriae bacterium HGW-Ignavibacteriae-4]
MFSSNVSAKLISCDEVKNYFDELPLDIYGHYAESEDYTNYSMYIDSIFNGSCVSVESIVEKFAQSGARRYNSFEPTYEQNMFDIKLTLFVEKNNIEIINILKEKDRDFIYNFFYFIKTPMKFFEGWPPGIQEKDKFPEFPEKYDKNLRKILFEVVSDIKKDTNRVGNDNKRLQINEIPAIK